MLLMIGTSDEVVCEFSEKHSSGNFFRFSTAKFVNLRFGYFYIFEFKNNTSAQTSSYQFVSHRYEIIQ